MNLFVKATRNGGPAYFSYVGQTQDVVTAMLTELGCSDIQFISEEEFRAGIQA